MFIPVYAKKKVGRDVDSGVIRSDLCSSLHFSAEFIDLIFF